MRKTYLARLLPLDYLEKIGRYQPKGEHHEKSGIKYPEMMMQQLREKAGCVLSVTIVELKIIRKGLTCIEKYACLTGGLQWYVPINWLVRVGKAKPVESHRFAFVDFREKSQQKT